MVKFRKILALITTALFAFSTVFFSGPSTNAAYATQKTVQQKLADRDFPSMFQAWNHENWSDTAFIAKHDLYWATIPEWGLQWQGLWEGEGKEFTEASKNAWGNTRDALLNLNPNLIMLAEIRYLSAPQGYLADNSDWWMYDSDHNRMPFIGQWMLNYYLSDFQETIIAQCVEACKLFDGILLDCWVNYNWADTDGPRIDLLRRIRDAIGDDKLIIVNSNQWRIPVAYQYVNGLFMECSEQQDNAEYWNQLSDTLRWAEVYLQEPRVNCIETWASAANQADVMRALNTLALTQSDGFATFCEKNNWHEHIWWEWLGTPLGVPVGAGYPRDDGMWQREYTNGTVIYNPKGNGQRTAGFGQNRIRASDNTTAASFSINEKDGDIFLYTASYSPTPVPTSTTTPAPTATTTPTPMTPAPSTTPTPSPTPTPGGTAQTYLASSDFSGTQGYKNWYYQQTDGSTYTDCTWNQGYYRWEGSQPCLAIGNNSMHPETGYSPVRKWVAPNAGTVRITGTVQVPSDGGDGVIPRVLLNASPVWNPGTVSYGSPQSHDITISVAAGDSLYFILDKNSSIMADFTFWDPQIVLN